MHLDILTPERKIFQWRCIQHILPGVQIIGYLLDNHAPMVALGKGQLKILKDGIIQEDI